MNRIDEKFRELRSEDRKVFIAYITAGDPDLVTTKKLALTLEASGVDMLELGIPFSDPIADGPAIQGSSYRALLGKVTLRKIFAMVSGLRRSSSIPVVFMTYYNPILQYGLKRFFASCQEYGVDGVIVPDLPYEEAAELISLAKSFEVATIFLAAPTSTADRIKKIAESSKGFIYYVSLTGVTGVRRELPKDVVLKINAIKSVTDKPVAVGFGVSSVEQAAMMSRAADGVIVGSAIVGMMAGKKNAGKKVAKFAKDLARVIHGR